MAAIFRQLRRLIAAKPLEPARLALGPVEIDISFRRHAQARRLILRLGNEANSAVVTVPKGVTRAQALDFVRRSSGWLQSRLDRPDKRSALKPGHTVPLRGENHEIRHHPVRRGVVAADPVAKIIQVPGDLPHVGRRLADWLKTVAREQLVASSERYAAAMDVSFRRISIRDQKSRWGSCTADGNLSYSWRLILTPPDVLDYVVAHEVAHLKHMNHGPQYWRLVLKHCPHANSAKKWLKAHGQDVHRIAAR